MATGIRKRHSRKCRTRNGAATCDCRPSFEAWVWSRRHNAKISRTFATESAAKTWRADATSAAARGRLRPQTKTTVRQAAEALLKGMEDGSVLNRRRKRYKPSTTRAYRRALGVDIECRERAPERILDRLGELRLCELDTATVQEWVNRNRAAGWDASTIGNMLDPLRCILRRARERGELGVDPLEHLELEKPTGRRMRIAAPAELEALLAAVDEADRPLWAAYAFAGLRRGEARAARVFDLDLKAETIRVERAWDDCEGEIDGKTDAAERTVPMVGPLPALLRARLMATGRRGSDLLFGETATEPFEPSTVRRRAVERWEAAGLKPIAPHELRHCYASLLIAVGVDLKRVSVFMGHSGIAITADRYGHLYPDARDETIRRVNAYLAAQEAATGPLKAVD